MPKIYEFIFFLGIQSIIYAFYLLLIWIYLTGNPILEIPIYIISLLQVSLLLISIYHIYLACSNPGYYSQDQNQNQNQNHNKNFCKKCRQEKPENVHHCSQCKRCVIHMDHHCIFLMNCIGYKNRKNFILFLFYSLLVSFFGCSLSLWCFLQTSWKCVLFLYIAIGLISLCVGLIILLCQQFILVSFDLTYIDLLKTKGKQEEIQNYPLRKRFRWTRVKTFLGKNWFQRLFPS